MIVLARDSGRHGRAVHARAEGLHSDAGHRPDHGDDRSGAGHVVRRHGRAPAAGCGDRREGHEHRGVHVERSAAADRVRRTRAACIIALKPRGDRAQRGRDRARSCARSCGELPGIERVSCRCRRRFRSAAASRRACISSRCRVRTSTTLYPRGAEAGREAAEPATSCRT